MTVSRASGLGLGVAGVFVILSLLTVVRSGEFSSTCMPPVRKIALPTLVSGAISVKRGTEPSLRHWLLSRWYMARCRMRSWLSLGVLKLALRSVDLDLRFDVVTGCWLKFCAVEEAASLILTIMRDSVGFAESLPPTTLLPPFSLLLDVFLPVEP